VGRGAHSDFFKSHARSLPGWARPSSPPIGPSRPRSRPPPSPCPLPLAQFGCQDASQVLKEVAQCQRAFPAAFIRLVAFDNLRQVQIMSFLVQRPRGATDYCEIPKRSVA
jgi:hypothetical protein